MKSKKNILLISYIPSFPLFPYFRKFLYPYFRKFLYPYFLISFLFFTSCEKDIVVDLPEYKGKIVVEGHIEPGMPPYVILTKSTGYFEPTDINSFEGLFVNNADVKVSDGAGTYPLAEICTGLLPDSLVSFVSNIIDVPEADLENFNFCIYTSFNSSIFGVAGKSYTLTIESEGELFTSTTTIPEPIALDSIWFDVQEGYDDMGFIWAHLTDPNASGTAYRWLAKRLNVPGESFIAPMESAFDDKFFNGKSFDLIYCRGQSANSETFDIESHFYKTGDTIVVKFSTIDMQSYLFYRSVGESITSGSSPFGTPTSLPTNIDGGGLGIWGGYGAVYDTIIAK